MYSSSQLKPTYVSVKTHIQESTGTRFPAPELVFRGMDVDPGIHDVVLTMRRGKKVVRYNIYFKKNMNLPVNHCVGALTAGSISAWYGDVLFMKLGSKIDGVVNWRREDDHLANLALKRFVSHVKQSGTTIYPLNLQFDE
ncbi:hypothetical protein CVT24_009524 [Panaeolus cyanescens]|uniref:Uncharacterized protein n=1 Tax=Panaeolus cyanescens TaxID=181874 RepID=A0A409X7A4_9AGAR|nr:hypothetical protein CVT24_009524 [Panaeolus cyanescens]